MPRSPTCSCSRCGSNGRATPDDTINESRLYRALDHRLPHKTALERHLATRYGELFAAEFDVLLSDLTSRDVEAALNDPMLQRGDSRDHRPDCLPVALAVIVTVEGFPLSDETFDGNRADVPTLDTVMRMVERQDGQARRVWVFDRGIVSEAHLAALRRRGARKNSPVGAGARRGLKTVCSGWRAAWRPAA